MAYIGKQPIVGNYQVLDALTATTTDTYALTKNSVAVFPQTPANCIVSLNGVIQAPFSSYTISGSNIVFASALTGSDSIDFITVLGDVLNVGTPSDNTVTTVKIVDGNVTSAKMFSGFANGITEADQWRLTADVTSDASPISSNWERVDETSFGKIGTGMTESSGIFSFPTTGLYLILGVSQITAISDALNFKIMVTTDNSNYDEYAYVNTYIASGTIRCNNSTSALVNVTNISNVKVRFDITGNDGSSTLHGDTNKSETVVSFIRLGDNV